MLQEMKLEDALKRFLRGRKVLVMYVEVPAVENPDFKEAVHQMAASEKLPPPKSQFGKKQRQRL